jgi:hypothetical protein
MLRKLRTEGMAVEDGPRLSGSCLLLGSMIRAPRRRCSRKLHAPGTRHEWGTSGVLAVGIWGHSQGPKCRSV